MGKITIELETEQETPVDIGKVRNVIGLGLHRVAKLLYRECEITVVGEPEITVWE